MKMKKSHWFVRGIGWVGVVIMILAAPALCAESYSCRDVAPWKLHSLSAFAFGAALCLARHLLFLAMAFMAFVKVKLSRWRRTREPSEEVSEMLAFKDVLAKDDRRFVNVVRFCICAIGLTIAVLLAVAWYKYGTDSIGAQSLWRCGGVVLIYIAGVLSVVFAFFAWINPIFRRLLGLCIRMLGFSADGSGLKTRGNG